MLFLQPRGGRGWGGEAGRQDSEAKDLGFLGFTKPKFKSTDTNFTRHGVNIRFPKRRRGGGERMLDGRWKRTVFQEDSDGLRKVNQPFANPESSMGWTMGVVVLIHRNASNQIITRWEQRVHIAAADK